MLYSAKAISELDITREHGEVVLIHRVLRLCSDWYPSTGSGQALTLAIHKGIAADMSLGGRLLVVIVFPELLDEPAGEAKLLLKLADALAKEFRGWSHIRQGTSRSSAVRRCARRRRWRNEVVHWYSCRKCGALHTGRSGPVCPWRFGRLRARKPNHLDEMVRIWENLA